MHTIICKTIQRQSNVMHGYLIMFSFYMTFNSIFKALGNCSMCRRPGVNASFLDKYGKCLYPREGFRKSFQMLSICTESGLWNKSKAMSGSASIQFGMVGLSYINQWFLFKSFLCFRVMLSGIWDDLQKVAYFIFYINYNLITWALSSFNDQKPTIFDRVPIQIHIYYWLNSF
jgi:hypothetical protein